LQTRLEHRFSGGYQLVMGYTWAHGLGYSEATSGAVPGLRTQARTSIAAASSKRWRFAIVDATALMNETSAWVSNSVGENRNPNLPVPVANSARVLNS
jgi:hypothetical protein